MLKRNLFFLFAITIFSIASFILCLFNYNPYAADFAIFANFYASFFCAITGVFAITIYFIKLSLVSDQKINSFFWPSIRQAALIALGATVLLMLKGMKILDWWVGGPLLLAVILLELFFQTNPAIKKKISKNSHI